MQIQEFFHPQTWTLSYLVYDDATRSGVVIDSVRDYDAKSGRTTWAAAEAIAAFADAREIRIPYVLDTHAHADHLSGIPFFKERYGAQSAIGAAITEVQQTFAQIFHLGAEFASDGRQFDRLLEDGDRLDAGGFEIEVLHTPGHTPACVTYRIGDALFVGDTLFMPDSGTARCDFPAGSAERLYDSIQRLYAFPDATRVLVCHDYQPHGRALAFETTVGEEKRANTQLRASTPKDAYVATRKARDATLEAPNLLLPSVQVNIRAGELPPAESNGIAYLKIPLNAI